MSISLLSKQLGISLRSTLNTKLAIALIIVVVTAATSMLLTSQYWMKSYHEELTQKLNASIAMYISDEYQLINEKGSDVNLAAISQLSNQAMIINPMAEVYLLDTQGKILAHAFPDESIVSERIPLAPIKSFIRGHDPYPIFGNDPKNLTHQTVFSATELKNEGKLQGYLYVVLGSQLYDDIDAITSESYSGKMALISTLMITVLAIISGLIVFKLILSRLKLLSRRLAMFAEQHSVRASTAQAPSLCEHIYGQRNTHDEIAVLNYTFEQMSEQINTQFDLLKESDAARRELISNVSHDLRTPLASMQGYLETLYIKEETLSHDERQQYLKTAISSANRLSKMVGELFELSKLEAATSPNIETFSLTELVYDTVQEFELEFKEKGIQYQIKHQQQNISVQADISLIQRVFENLVRNAIAYTPENGLVTFELEQDHFSSQQPVKVRIIDSGVGIDAEDLPYIFDRFYTNPDRSREGTSSTGLGLAIVKRILDLHDSSIHVESHINGGTKFEFNLPMSA